MLGTPQARSRRSASLVVRVRAVVMTVQSLLLFAGEFPSFLHKQSLLDYDSENYYALVKFFLGKYIFISLEENIYL